MDRIIDYNKDYNKLFNLKDEINNENNLNFNLLEEDPLHYQKYDIKNFNYYKFILDNKYYDNKYSEYCKNEYNLYLKIKKNQRYNVENNLIIKNQILTRNIINKIIKFKKYLFWNINEVDNILKCNLINNIYFHNLFYKNIEKFLEYKKELKIYDINLINYEYGKTSGWKINDNNYLFGPIIYINLSLAWNTNYEGNFCIYDNINSVNYIIKQNIPGQIILIEPQLVTRWNDLSIYAKKDKVSNLILEYKTIVY